MKFELDCRFSSDEMAWMIIALMLCVTAIIIKSS